MHESEFDLEVADGQRLFCRRWSGDDVARAVVQIAHGASEHSARYAGVAGVLVDAGYEVYANDHRGHGRTARDFGRYGVARPGGWEAMVRDLHDLTERIGSDRPGLPIVLFGHSMGSMLAQDYLQRWGAELAGAVLSGTTGGSVVDEATLEVIVALGAGDAADEPSEPFAAMFDGFNAPFAGDGATGYEWLSHDVDEVRAYVDDPWCGEPLSNGFVADMMSGTVAMWAPEREAAAPSDLPVYLFSGSDDPVGGENAESVRELARRYEALGVGPVTSRIYEGGRHEMLNEIERDRVHADLIAWLGSLSL